MIAQFEQVAVVADEELEEPLTGRRLSRRLRWAVGQVEFVGNAGDPTPQA